MNRKEIEYKIQDLKAEYVRLQHALEKREFVKGNLSPPELQLEGLEKELKVLNEQLAKMEENDK